MNIKLNKTNNRIRINEEEWIQLCQGQELKQRFCITDNVCFDLTIQPIQNTDTDTDTDTGDSNISRYNNNNNSNSNSNSNSGSGSGSGNNNSNEFINQKSSAILFRGSNLILRLSHEDLQKLKSSEKQKSGVDLGLYSVQLDLWPLQKRTKLGEIHGAL
ncbi:MAG: hypothetical protein ACXVCN_09160 [Bdellovibrio sp.]